MSLLHSIRTLVHLHTDEACRLGLITTNILPSCDVPDVPCSILDVLYGYFTTKQERQSIQPTANEQFCFCCSETNRKSQEDGHSLSGSGLNKQCRRPHN